MTIQKKNTHGGFMDSFDVITREDGRRAMARDVVKASGFALWRKLVDKAYALLSSGLGRERVADILATQTPRLPQKPPLPR